MTFPVYEYKPGSRFQNSGDLGKTGWFIGDGPDHVNAECAVEGCAFKAGRIKSSALIRTAHSKRASSCPGLLKGYRGKIDANELRTGCACNPLAGASATTSEIRDSATRPDLERIGQV